MLHYLDVRSTDPAYNLALEQYVFEALPREETYFLLWQNDKSIIVGRHQNTLAEVNESYARANGIRVVRRLSGGGAVYHDLGNLNFSFIADAADAEKLDFSFFCRPVIRTLASMGVEAALSGRNDITVGGRKISGNAQYIKKGRLLQHGTLLFDSNLDAVDKALLVDAEKMQTKGIRSVRSRITNVREHLKQEISLSEFRRRLLAQVLEEVPGRALALTQTDIAAIEAVRAERYASWEWNYGQSPAASFVKRKRIQGCGTVEVRIFMDRGLIENVTFEGDFFSLEDPEALGARFKGVRPEPEAYVPVLRETDASHFIAGLSNEELLGLLGS